MPFIFGIIACLICISLHQARERHKINQAQKVLSAHYSQRGKLIRGLITKDMGFGPQCNSKWEAFSRSFRSFDVFLQVEDGTCSYASWLAKYHGLYNTLEEVYEMEVIRPFESYPINEHAGK